MKRATYLDLNTSCRIRWQSPSFTGLVKCESHPTACIMTFCRHGETTKSTLRLGLEGFGYQLGKISLVVVYPQDKFEGRTTWRTDLP